MRKSTVLIALILGGCANVAPEDQGKFLLGGYNAIGLAKPFSGPDGRQGYAVTCGSDMAVCYDRAAKSCGGEYEVIGRSTTPEADSSSHSGSIEVLCKKP